ncbi:MAG: DUF2283 domain-containing protein [Deltaproteobacteria bacterium]|nr:DUF2283 domain-containing protein [Deltaproteobacteria bacterium]
MKISYDPEVDVLRILFSSAQYRSIQKIPECGLVRGENEI